MSDNNLMQTLATTVDKLSNPQSFKGLFHPHRDGNPLPSGKVLEEIVILLRAILFPGYYGNSSVNTHTLHYHIGVDVERLYHLLSQQIQAGLCFVEYNQEDKCNCNLKQIAHKLASQLIERLPAIRETLSTDVIAAFNGDPAAENTSEVISCYPIIKTLTN